MSNINRLVSLDLLYIDGFTDYVLEQADSGSTTYTLTTDAGSYTVTGSAATLTVIRALATSPGSYEVTGFPASLTLTRGFIDTHDGGPRKRKKQDRDEFAEFAEQQAKRRKAIADVVDPQEPVEAVAAITYEPVPPLLVPVQAPPKDDSFERFMRELQEDEELFMML